MQTSHKRRSPATDATASSHVAWRKIGRGSYMPTPLIYGAIVYVLSNAGLFDAYDLATESETPKEMRKAA